MLSLKQLKAQGPQDERTRTLPNCRDRPSKVLRIWASAGDDLTGTVLADAETCLVGTKPAWCTQRRHCKAAASTDLAN